MIDEALAAEAFWPDIGDQPEISALAFGKTPGIGFFFDREVDEDVHVAIETVVSARSRTIEQEGLDGCALKLPVKLSGPLSGRVQ